MDFKKVVLCLFLLTISFSITKGQNYYSGKITSNNTSYIKLNNKDRQKKQKRKIYVQQVIDSTFILVNIIIKDGHKKAEFSRKYERYIPGKHYSDFRLFVKKRNNDEVRYIKTEKKQELDLYDGILRSLLPDFEFFHEKTHRTHFHDQLENRYIIAFDIIKEEDETIFKHKFQYAKTLEMINFYYTATGISNSQNEIETLKIGSIFWKGSAAQPFRQDNTWVELGKIRKRRKLKKIKRLFQKLK